MGKSFLDAELVERICIRRRRISALKDEDKKESDLVKQQFANGYICPTDGAYVLETEPHEVLAIEMKEIFLNYLTARFAKRYGKKFAVAMAKERLEKVLAETPRKTEIHLVVKVNAKQRLTKAVSA